MSTKHILSEQKRGGLLSDGQCKRTYGGFMRRLVSLVPDLRLSLDMLAGFSHQCNKRMVTQSVAKFEIPIHYRSYTTRAVVTYSQSLIEANAYHTARSSSDPSQSA